MADGTADAEDEEEVESELDAEEGSFKSRVERMDTVLTALQ